MEEWVVLVDENDIETGYEEKIKAHAEGKLHRAFSVYIYDDKTDRLLLQKRGGQKYHSGGLWSNSCCSHPLQGETWAQAIGRCISNELGILPGPEEVDKMADAGKFRYKSFYKNTENYEHEIDHVWVYMPEKIWDRMNPNPDEVEKAEWVSVEKIDAMIRKEPETFTSWFIPSYRIFREYIEAYR